MHRPQLHYTLSNTAGSPLIRNPLIDLLQAVSAEGSISAAARALNLSYRHVWGELKRWEKELNCDLVVWEKGHAARLTAAGARLVQAEADVQARMAPQIEALHSALEQAYTQALKP